MARKKKKRLHTVEPYSEESQVKVAARLDWFRQRYPDVPERELKVREVLSRYKGEAGLTEAKVLSLTCCIMRALDGSNERYSREMGDTFYDATG